MTARWAIAALALAAAIFAGCGEADDPVPSRPTPTPTIEASGARQERSVIDMAGRQVLVPATVRRVAAMSPSAAEFAAVLGLETVTRSSDTPESAAPGAKVAGSAISPDFNAIAAAKPDLVIADTAFQSGRTRDFDRFGYPVFILKAASYSDVLAAVSALGEASGETEKAAAARQSIEERANATIERAQARAAAGAAPKVLILTGGGRDVFGGGTSTYAGSLVEALKGTNVLGATPQGGPIEGFGVIESAQAATLKPDVVLVLSSGQGGLAAQIRADAAWANTSAALRGRIYDLDTSMFLRSPGPRAAEALEALFALLWP